MKILLALAVMFLLAGSLQGQEYGDKHYLGGDSVTTARDTVPRLLSSTSNKMSDWAPKWYQYSIKAWPSDTIEVSTTAAFTKVITLLPNQSITPRPLRSANVPAIFIRLKTAVSGKVGRYDLMLTGF